MPENPTPTEAELNILRVLWERGPSTVRDVMETLQSERNAGYTTILKFLQIMYQKGLVTRNEASKTHVYAAAVPAEKTRRHLVRDLMDKAFSGSVSQLLQHALGSRKTSATEIKNIRRLLEEFDQESPPSTRKPKS